MSIIAQLPFFRWKLFCRLCMNIWVVSIKCKNELNSCKFIYQIMTEADIPLIDYSLKTNLPRKCWIKQNVENVLSIKLFPCNTPLAIFVKLTNFSSLCPPRVASWRKTRTKVVPFVHHFVSSWTNNIPLLKKFAKSVVCCLWNPHSWRDFI